MDLSYDPDMPPARKPRAIASSPFWTGTGAYTGPGLQAPPPPPPLGMHVPTPAGWLPAGGLGNAVADFAGNLVPSRQGVAQTLGAPMDGLAWLARQLGAKGIPETYVQPDITQRIGRDDQFVRAPSADVPLSSQNILRMMDNPPDMSALIRLALSRPGRF